MDICKGCIDRDLTALQNQLARFKNGNDTVGCVNAAVNGNHGIILYNESRERSGQDKQVLVFTRGEECLCTLIIFQCLVRFSLGGLHKLLNIGSQLIKRAFPILGKLKGARVACTAPAENVELGLGIAPSRCRKELLDICVIGRARTEVDLNITGSRLRGENVSRRVGIGTKERSAAVKLKGALVDRKLSDNVSSRRSAKDRGAGSCNEGTAVDLCDGAVTIPQEHTALKCRKRTAVYHELNGVCTTAPECCRRGVNLDIVIIRADLTNVHLSARYRRVRKVLRRNRGFTRYVKYGSMGIGKDESFTRNHRTIVERVGGSRLSTCYATLHLILLRVGCHELTAIKRKRFGRVLFRHGNSGICRACFKVTVLKQNTGACRAGVEVDQ